MARFEVTENSSALIERLRDKTSKVRPDSPELRRAFTRIGILVSSQAILNVRRHKLIDTGRLFNSIRYEFFQERNVQGVRVGSFGVPYAAVHEFGFQGSVSIRAHKRLMTKVFGRTVDPRNVQVSAHNRFMRIKEKPYLRPAVRRHQKIIVDMLREALRV